MPVGVDKIHPFLAAVRAGRAVEEAVGSRKGLVQKGNEVGFSWMILDPFVLDCNGRCGFSHCLFNLLGFYTNTRFHLRKTNTANEEPVGRLLQWVWKENLAASQETSISLLKLLE